MTDPFDPAAVRAAYDDVAADYAEHVAGELAAKPLARAMLGVTALDVADGTLAGALACYSTIHLPPAALPVAFAELARALAPGGHLLVAFQVGDDASVRDEAYGRPISLAFHRWQPDAIVDLLAAAGLAVDARMVRAPDDGERTPHAHLLAHRPAP